MAAVKGFSVRFRGKHLFFINIPQILLYVFLGLFVCFTALPLIYVISTAFKPMDELFLYPPRFFVRNPTMSNFGDLVRRAGQHLGCRSAAQSSTRCLLRR